MHKSIKNVLGAVVVSLMALTFASGCGDGGGLKEVSLDERETVSETSNGSAPDSLRFAVGAMLVPKKGFAHYYELLKYVEAELGMPIHLVDRESYEEINVLLREENIDGAFVCSGPYVDGHDEFGLEILAVPVAYGQAVYHSYIIVHRDSDIESFGDLRGKTFAFTDPQSNSGKVVPTHLLASMEETPESYFGKHLFTYAHDKSIMAVAQRLVDGAAVDSLIWEYDDKKAPEYTSQTKVIWQSEACGIPPVVVRKNLDADLKKKLRRIFLTLHDEERGRAILAQLMIDRFEEGSDSAYDSIRRMKTFQTEFLKERDSQE